MTGLPPLSTLGLGLVLGLRHGLDPDHVAVIDNITFRLLRRRSPLASWVGTLFAGGHSLSVAAVAIGVSLAAIHLPLPDWIGAGVDWMIIVLLLLVGALNLRALLRRGDYAPLGWRQGFLPRRLMATDHPAGIFAVGILFGLVFDTASQVAAWSLATASKGGTLGVAVIAAMFAIGMILTDSVDSIIVARLLSMGGDPQRVRRYRRAVGWIIVGLSFGMAGVALAEKLRAPPEAPGGVTLMAGAAMAGAVIATLLWGWLRQAFTPRG
jgi:high-affinity nickel-transport protein